MKRTYLVMAVLCSCGAGSLGAGEAGDRPVETPPAVGQSAHEGLQGPASTQTPMTGQRPADLRPWLQTAAGEFHVVAFEASASTRRLHVVVGMISCGFLYNGGGTFEVAPGQTQVVVPLRSGYGTQVWAWFETPSTPTCEPAGILVEDLATQQLTPAGADGVDCWLFASEVEP